MAGLARAQQIFNRAVLGTLAILIGFARGGRADEAAAVKLGAGMPLLAKLIKSNAPRKGRPGRPYPGYCAGAQETARRHRQLERGIVHTQHYPVTVYPSSEAL